MILFNWFGVSLIPIQALIAMQIPRMAIARRSSPTHAGLRGRRSPLFLVANVCWLLAAFPPRAEPGADADVKRFRLDNVHHSGSLPHRAERDPCPGDLFRRSARPIFNRWVAYFNLLVAAALVPAAFAGVALTGPLAWDGVLSFWLKNIAIAVWIIGMGVVLGQAVYGERAENHRQGEERDGV